MLADGQIVPYESPGRKWIYTSGISLMTVRKLMAPDTLSR